MKKLICVILISFQALLLSHLAWTMSINRTEVGHLGSAVYFAQTLKLDVFHVNPPLTRMVTSFFTHGLHYDARTYSPRAIDRCEWAIGNSVAASNPKEEVRSCVFWMRLSLIPIILLGGYFGYRFAKELYGGYSALTFLTLWTFSPLVLGWGATLCPDAAAASLGIIGLYAFWHWLKEPAPAKGVASGVLLSLMCLTKLTWIIAFPLFVLLWLVFSRKAFCQFAVLLLVGVITLNAGYFYSGSFQPLSSYSFRSEAMTSIAESLSPKVPVPVPRELMMGLDTQRVDFEKGQESYLNGEYGDRGWKQYYLYVLAYREPVGVILLFTFAVLSLFFRRQKDEGVVLVSLLFVFLVISSQDGISAHPRYILPLLPLLYLFISRLKFSFLVIVLCLLTSAADSLDAYPHSMSYFNECFENPREYPKYLLGSNIDHGQDCYELQTWLEKHPDIKPFISVYSAETLNAPKVPYEKQDGWMIISVNELYRRDKKYDWLTAYNPVDSVGYSILVYRVEESNRKD